MADVSLENVTKQVRDLFNKGLAALEHGNLDYAVDILSTCVEKEPRLLNARKFLRAAEVKRFKQTKHNSLSLGLLDAKGLPGFLKAVGLEKAGKPQQAMATLEKLFRTNPLSTKYAKLFATAAIHAEMPDAAIVTLETARDHNAEDVSLIAQLGSLYLAGGRTSSARECFERLCELCPNDPNILKQLKDTMAIDSMANDGWNDAAEKGASFHDMLKDEKEAVQLEKESKAKKSEDDLGIEIEQTKKKIEDDPKNINYYRALGNLYVQKNLFDDAVDILTTAQKMNPGDGEIDRTLTAAKIKGYDFRIDQLTEAGDENAATELKNERLQFVFDDLQERVERYPNDLQLKFEWGVMLYDSEYINEAIQQFQLSQRNPKVRVKTLYYLGLCFKSKKQFDLAMEQFEDSASEIMGMDALKKEILYELGTTAEEAGHLDKAGECYKKIYQTDIGFRDVAQKMEALYAQRS